MSNRNSNNIPLTEIVNNAHKIAKIGIFQFLVKESQIYWNDVMKEINEVQPDFKPTPENIFSFFPNKKTKQYIEHTHEKAIKEGSSFSYDHEIITAKGNTKHIWTFGQPVFKNGVLIKIFGTSIDITERKKSELELVNKNKLLNFAEQMTNIAYWDWDTVINEEIWSDNLYKIVNRKKGGKLTYETYLEYVHPNDKDYVIEQITSAFENKVFPSFSHRIIVNTSEIKIIHLMGEVICNPDGDVIRMLGTCQDITEIKNKELELLQKNQQLSLAEEIAQIGYWEWNPNTDSFIWSDNLYRIFGFEIGLEMSLELLTTRIHPNDQEKIERITNELFKTKIFKKFSYRIIPPEGHIKTLEVVGQIVCDEKGEIIKFTGVTKDITDYILKEKKILETNEHLEQATQKLTARNKQLAEFNHITSHNLRSPVSNLNALLGMYKDPTYEHLKEELFQKFEIVVDHLTLTLNTLVESLKVKHEANKSIQQLSFDETLNKTKEILAAEIIQTNANIKCNFTDAPKIVYNQIYLESIFLNLLGNAMKYKSKDRAPEIEIKSKEVNGRVQLSFKDNGIGIDLKQHGDKLFGLNKVFHRHPDAKGVGLFLTKAQIEAMGGSISAQSKVNEGSTFTVTLN
ncbi:PAS domain-containing protein [Maribacter sp. LLG6340-A2]|uniref:PAS domain-containing sensor histidine kinase n=1 Tax=Maribacter sp. LLG6340-A2 TaxID=3160834 RepID=UPI003862E141